jgi:hypothetical protein
MMSHLCNRRVREFLILTCTWFAFGLPSKTGCDTLGLELLRLGFSLRLCALSLYVYSGILPISPPDA